MTEQPVPNPASEETQKLSISQEMLFSNHPGYPLIMEWLPKAYVAVCSNPRMDRNYSPVKLALASLIRLYDYLCIWEQDQAKLGVIPNESERVVASRDFSMGAELLLHRLTTAEPRLVTENALEVSGLVEIYISKVGYAKQGSVTFAKSLYP